MAGPAEAVVGAESTRATFLSWPDDVRRGFLAELRDQLGAGSPVGLTLQASVTLAQVARPGGNVCDDRAVHWRAADRDGRAGVIRDLLVRAWHAAGPLQGWIAWRLHARFGVGVTGIVRARDGRVLLLRHRLWEPDAQWGFPSGFAARGEAFPDTIVREVREETGLSVRVGRLADVRSGFRYRVEVYYEATLAGGLEGLVIEEREIIEAQLFPLDALPAHMPPLHRELAHRGQS